MGLFDGLDTPKWQDPSANAAGGVRNFLSIMQFMQGKKEFAADQALKVGDQAIRSKESDARIAAHASDQKLTDFKLTQEIDSTGQLANWLTDLPTNDVDAILAKPLPTNPKAAMEAIKFREGAARAAAMGADGERRASFWAQFAKLDAPGAAKVNEYEPGSWPAWMEMEVQQDRIAEKAIVEKERLQRSAQDAMMNKMLEVDTLRGVNRTADAAELETQRQAGRMEVVTKQLEARAGKLSGKLDPKAHQVFKARYDAAIAKGDYNEVDRVISEYETGETAPQLSMQQKDIMDQIEILEKERKDHRKQLNDGDQASGLGTLIPFYNNRNRQIEAINKKLEELYKRLEGKPGAAPAAPAAAAPSARPRLRWDSSTNSLTR